MTEQIDINGNRNSVLKNIQNSTVILGDNNVIPAPPDIITSIFAIIRTFQFLVPLLGQFKPVKWPHQPPADGVRCHEVKQLVESIEKVEPRGIILTGRPGVGKTIFARRVLHHQNIVDKYGIWRFEICLKPEMTEFEDLVIEILGNFRNVIEEGKDYASKLPKEKLSFALTKVFGENRCIICLCNVLDQHSKFVEKLLYSVKDAFVLVTTHVPNVEYKLNELGLTVFEMGKLSNVDAIKMLTFIAPSIIPVEILNHIESYIDCSDEIEKISDKAIQFVNLLDNQPKQLKTVARDLKEKGKSIDYFVTEWNARNDFRSQWGANILSATEKDMMKSVLTKISYAEKILKELAVFAPYPATFVCPSNQEALYAKLYMEGLFEEPDNGRYSITQDIQNIIRELWHNYDFQAESQKHAEVYAKKASAAHQHYLEEGRGFLEFRDDWANIDKGWQWALNEHREVHSKITYDLLVEYAKSITYLDPFYDFPIEKIRRLEAVVNSQLNEGVQEKNAHLWISLVQAYLDFEKLQIIKSEPDSKNFQVVKSHLDKLLETFENSSAQMCAVYVAYGNLYSHECYQNSKLKLADDYYFRAQAIAQKQAQGIAQNRDKREFQRYECYAQIGRAELCNLQEEVRQAIGYYTRSLEIALFLHDVKAIARCLGGLSIAINKHIGISEPNNRDEFYSEMRAIARNCYESAKYLNDSMML